MGGGGDAIGRASQYLLAMEEWKEKKRKARRRKKKKKKEKGSPTFGPIDAAQAYMCVWWYSEVRYTYICEYLVTGSEGVIGFFQSAISSRLLSHGRVGGRNLRVTFAFLSSPSAPSASYNSWFSTSQWEPLMPSLILCVYVCFGSLR